MSRFFVNRPIVAIVIAIVTVVGGLVAMRALPIAQFPDIIPPQIIVTANYIGADAVTIEQAVATPLEQQMNGVDNMLYMQSTNANDGTMQLSVTFGVETDPNVDQVNVQNRIAQAQPNLPPDVNTFGLTLRKSTGFPMLVIALSSPNKTYDNLYLANYATINIIDSLYRIRGVGDIRIFGGSDYAMRIWVKPDLLARLGITVPELARAVQQQSTVNPAGQVGAQPAPPGQEMTYTVRAQGRLQTPEEFEAIAVRANPDGSMVRLKDVARVELGALNYQQTGRIDGLPGCAIGIFQMPGSNALEVADAVKQTMADLARRFPADVKYGYPIDTTLAVTEGIREILITLGEALLLVIFVVLPVPAELARHAHPDGGGPGLADRHLHVLSRPRLLDQHALPLRPRPRHRPGGRRCDRGGRGGGTAYRERVVAERSDAPGHAGGVGAGRQHRADSGVGVHSGRVHGRHPGPSEQAVRDHHRHLGDDFRLQRADAVAGAGRDAAATAEANHRSGSGAPSAFSTGGSTKATHGYVSVSRGLIRKAVVGVALLLAFTAAGAELGRRLPASFVPEEDYGYFTVNLQLPPAASMQRTDAVARKIEQVLLNTEGVLSFNATVGFSFYSRVTASNYGLFFVGLKPWDERNRPELAARAIVDRVNAEIRRVAPEATAFAAMPPSIPGLGSVGGFSIWLQDRSGGTIESLEQTLQKFLAAARQRPELAGVTSTFNASVPQLYAAVDRDKVLKQGVALPDVYQTMQAFLGGLYINQFNRFGRQWRVFLQAEPEERSAPANVSNFYVRNNDGDMVPLSTLQTTGEIRGPQYTNRFNVYRAAQVTGGPAPGYSSGQALDAVEEVLRETLPPEFGFDYADLSYQERQGVERGLAGLRAFDRLRVPDSRSPLRKLVAAVLGPAVRAGCGVRGVRRAVTAALRERRLRADRHHHVDRPRGEERDPDCRIRQAARRAWPRRGDRRARRCTSCGSGRS